MSTAGTERELKLGAWPEFSLPDLNGFVDGATAAPPTRRELDAVYYDTPDLRLLRRGVTLRFRRGEAPGDVWTAKLPSDAAAHGLARREVNLSGPARAIPAQLADLTRGWALGAALRPVARIRTARSSIPLRDADGRIVASLDDDAVSVMRGRRVVARFRELEVELVADASAEILERVDARLRSAGAERVPQTPKLTRAFGRIASEPPSLAPPELGSKATIGVALHARLLVDVGRLVDQHAPVVLDEQPGCVGRARAEVRAVVADLAAFATLLDGELTEPLRRELVWLEVELGAVAELDDLSERMPASAGDAVLGDLITRAATQRLVARVRMARARRRSRLMRVLRSRRYAALLGRLNAFAAEPLLTTGQARRRVDAGRAKLVRPAWRRLRDQGQAASAGVDSGAIAALRPSADQLAATLALARMAPGPEPRRSAQRIEELVTLLAEHEAATAAARGLRTLRRRADPELAWVAGVLAGREAARADDCRARFGAVWARVARKPAWSWAD
jgi:inorganic triphosphatase YgiF